MYRSRLCGDRQTLARILAWTWRNVAVLSSLCAFRPPVLQHLLESCSTTTQLRAHSSLISFASALLDTGNRPSGHPPFITVNRRPFMTAGGSVEKACTESGDASSLPSFSKPRGAFIVLEGVDRCGKTTQVAQVVKALHAQGRAAEAIRFPDRTTTIGQMINAYLANATDLDDRVIHLLFSANRWEAMASLRSKLAAGMTLVCDRYAYSGVAFSAAKDGMDFDWCKQCDRGLPQPDAVIYLDISAEAAAKRGQYGEERYENQGMQCRVRENFQKLMEGDNIWHVVDAGVSLEEVSEGVDKVVMATAKRVEEEGLQLGTLWPA
ncbi:hypothetical protein NSK_003895 [Nannochloropsis salina CCMP1776]|uniref:Thymidylate kinase n=1 Tax=Nannochloropsis salina CCMP1776 TaxID=1027361 RepID=A0A4D9D4A7_9STRA|nr:hypothetical protein NSK_003895 [Nannochloropsis salina CCMP1776]|eukprot:TFJ84863.1 hypothetical protein NSK_003895 [Nannochloropsis salina CCMP1776]